MRSPPLYKVKRGQSEQYLKDQGALEDYLIAQGSEDTSLTLANGEVRMGQDLRQAVDTARIIADIFDGLHSRYNRDVVEQAAIAGALNTEILEDHSKAEEAAAYIARRLDILADEFERGWVGEARDDGSLVFKRTVRGVQEAATIDAALLGSADARRLAAHAEHLHEVYGKAAVLRTQGCAYRNSRASCVAATGVCVRTERYFFAAL